MTREEAINEIKSWAIPSKKGREVLETLIPELCESEDERIRKEIIEFIQWSEDRGMTRHDFHQAKRPSEWIAYLEKRKDANKAIEAVDRIDKYIKYIRVHTANAHNMNDSNPDKKYYIGVDDTLSNIAGILNGVYSEEKQKEQKSSTEETELNSIAFLEEMGYTCIPPRKEQKPVKIDEDIELGLDRALMIVKDAKGVLPGYQTDDGIYECDHAIRTLTHILKNGIEQKLIEWSEEDENNLELVIDCIYKFYPDPVMKYKLKEWLKSLRPSKDCSSCAKNLEGYISGRSDAENKLLEQFGALITPEDELHIKPRWKPSEEQLNYVNWAYSIAVAENNTKAIEVLGELHDTLLNLI